MGADFPSRREAGTTKFDRNQSVGSQILAPAAGRSAMGFPEHLLRNHDPYHAFAGRSLLNAPGTDPNKPIRTPYPACCTPPKHDRDVPHTTPRPAVLGSRKNMPERNGVGAPSIQRQPQKSASVRAERWIPSMEVSSSAKVSSSTALSLGGKSRSDIPLASLRLAEKDGGREASRRRHADPQNRTAGPSRPRLTQPLRHRREWLRVRDTAEYEIFPKIDERRGTALAQAQPLSTLNGQQAPAAIARRSAELQVAPDAAGRQPVPSRRLAALTKALRAAGKRASVARARNLSASSR